MEHLLMPILKKLKYWRDFDKGYKKQASPEGKKQYRILNDLDCQLNDGNNYADTLFSLWWPLKFTLREISARWWKKDEFYSFILCDMQSDEVYLKRLEKFLPVDNELVVLLSELFVYGTKKCNTFILEKFFIEETDCFGWENKEYSLNIIKGIPPYNDYIPFFLYNCLKGEAFVWKGIKTNCTYKGRAFQTAEAAVEWIKKQHLEVLFMSSENICVDGIIKISGKDNIRDNKPNGYEELKRMLKLQIDILKKRERVMDI